MKDNTEIWEDRYQLLPLPKSYYNKSFEAYEYSSSCPDCGGHDRVSVFAGLGKLIAICRDQGRAGCGKKFYRNKEEGAAFNGAIQNQSTNPKKPQDVDYSDEVNYFHQKIWGNQQVFDYAISRGLKEEIIKEYRLGACFFDNRLALIIPSADGKFYTRRFLDTQKPKYRTPTGSKPVSHYNNNSNTVIIVDGSIDAVLLSYYAKRDIVTYWGAFTPNNIAPFCKNYETVIVWLDWDSEGEAEKLCGQLKKLLNTRSRVRYPLGFSDINAVLDSDFKDVADLFCDNRCGLGFIDKLITELEPDTKEKHLKDHEPTQKRVKHKITYKYIKDLESAKETVTTYRNEERVAVDIETMPLKDCLQDRQAGLIPYKNQIRLVQLHAKGAGTTIFDMMFIKDFSFLKLLALKRCVFHNAMFDLFLLEREGIIIRDFFDTLIFNRVIMPPNLYREGDVLNLSKEKTRILKNRAVGLKQACVFWLDKPDYSEEHSNWHRPELPERKLVYAALDVVNTLDLFDYFHTRSDFKENKKTYDIFISAFPTVFMIYKNGLSIDLGKIEHEISKKEKCLIESSKEVGFNLNSTKQVQDYFKSQHPKIYEKALSQKLVTAKGSLSLGDGSWEQFCIILKELGYEEIAQAIRSYKKASKGLSNLKQYYNYCSPSGEIHTMLALNGAITGRFTCSKPNLQNIKNDSEYEESTRGLFKCPTGKRYVLADYSQQELRVFALVADENGLIQAFDNNKDIHGHIAHLAFDVPYMAKETKYRKDAKTISFGLLYGMGVKKLAENLGVSLKEAKRKKQLISDTFPHLSRLEMSLKESWQKEKSIKVPCASGEYRNIIDVNLLCGTHKLVNYHVQGAGGSIMIQAMVLWNKSYGVDNSECDIVNSIHDELIFCVDENKIEDWKPRIIERMEQAFIDVLPQAKRWKGDLLDIIESKTFRKRENA